MHLFESNLLFEKVFNILAFCIALKLGTDPWIMFILCFGCFVEYYLANWQTYVSGWYYFGTIDCTEGEMGTVSVLLLSSIFGNSIWEHNVNFQNEYLHSKKGVFMEYVLIFLRYRF